MISEGALYPRDSTDISVKPQLRPCYNIYVTFSKALSLCSACNSRDVSVRYCTARQKLRKSHGDDVENMRDIIMLAFA